MQRLAIALASIFVVSYASAQPPPGPPVHEVRRSTVLTGGAIARVVTRWTPDGATSGASLAIGDEAPTILARGATAAAVERGDRVAVVAYETYGSGSPFRVRVIRHEAGHDVLDAERSLARPGTRTDDVPFAVAIAPIPGSGFAVFFEEGQSDDPTAARTYLFLLDQDGASLDAGHEIAVPWPLAAAAWNGSGFHLALLYPGTGTGMRLSMVSTSEDGSPRGHPDWSSPAGFVDDVHLVVHDGHVDAHYRGGARSEHWLETDVTAIESWGTDRRHAIDHGAIEPETTLAVDVHGQASRTPPRPHGL